MAEAQRGLLSACTDLVGAQPWPFAEKLAWWVVDNLVGGEVEGAFDALVPRWIVAD